MPACRRARAVRRRSSRARCFFFRRPPPPPSPRAARPPAPPLYDPSCSPADPRSVVPLRGLPAAPFHERRPVPAGSRPPPPSHARERRPHPDPAASLSRPAHGGGGNARRHVRTPTGSAARGQCPPGWRSEWAHEAARSRRPSSLPPLSSSRSWLVGPVAAPPWSGWCASARCGLAPASAAEKQTTPAWQRRQKRPTSRQRSRPVHPRSQISPSTTASAAIAARPPPQWVDHPGNGRPSPAMGRPAVTGASGGRPARRGQPRARGMVSGAGSAAKAGGVAPVRAGRATRT